MQFPAKLYQDKTSFVYRPGGAVIGNFYDDWTKLMAQVAVSSGPRDIYIDDSIVSPAVIPAGVYDLTNVTIHGGRNDGFSAIVQTADGTTLNNLLAIKDFIEFHTLNTGAATITVPNGASNFVMENNVVLVNDGTVPSINFPTGGNILLNLSAGIGFGGGKAIQNQAGGLFITLLDASGFSPDELIGPGGTAVRYLFDDTSFPSDAASQPGFGGPTFTTFLATADKDGYTPGVPANWTVPPTQVAQALDELAAGTGTKIDGLYWVAGNGVDATADGSLHKPFLTINAAIARAIADGHGFANPAEVLVLPKAAGYGGFVAQSGINVKGLAEGDSLTRISGQVGYVPDASGLATNKVEISNLEIVNTVGVAILCGNVNPGAMEIRDCTLVGSNIAVDLNNESGGTLLIENCQLESTANNSIVIDSGSGDLTIRNSSLFINNVNGGSIVQLNNTIAAIPGSTKISNCKMEVRSTAAIVQTAVACIGRVLEIVDSQIFNGGTAGGYGLDIGLVSTVQVTNLFINMDIGGTAVHIVAPSILNHSLLSFAAGGSQAVVTTGTINDDGVFRQRDHKFTYVLQAADILAQFFDMDVEATAESIAFLWSAGQPPMEGATEDYTVSIVGGVTRITFVAGGTLNVGALAGQKVQLNCLF